MRSLTVNDGSLQSRCTVLLGCRSCRNDLGNSVAEHVRPYKADVGGSKPSAPTRKKTLSRSWLGVFDIQV
ncbi:hypothetical protein ACWGQ5_49525, partial [Streptomyces sp. NPDC055722]